MIVHLVVLIVLLLSTLGREIAKENSFILDFTKFEEMEKLKKELSLKEEISRKLDKLIADGEPVRNVSVNRGALKDDRNTDADQLYKDAERLQKDLDKGFKHTEDEIADPGSKPAKEEKKKEERKYSGPSVLSWELEGRKASYLPIPAYRCMGAGEVKVIITVNNSGTVVGAKIDESCSSNDGCLRDFAIRASRRSRFSASPTAPPAQLGYIIYQFIAQ